MYKGSKYNILIKDTGKKKLVFNSLSGGLILVENRIYDYLTQNGSNVSMTEIAELKENGFIVEHNLDEYGFLVFKERELIYSTSAKSLAYVICPTLKCNYKCVYCYEASDDCNSSFSLESTVMSEETAEQVCNFVAREIKEQTGVDSLHVTWFGGEPLIAPQIIDKISQRLIRVCDETHTEYSSSIITNGSLLSNDGIIEQLQRDRVDRIQITFDGLRDKYCEYKGTSDANFRAVLDILSSIQKKFNLSVRLNVDKGNYESVMELACKFLEQDQNIYLYLAPIKYEKEQVRAFSAEEFHYAREAFWDMLISKGNRTFINNDLPKSKLIACGALMHHNYVILPNGNLQKCERTIGNEPAIGDVTLGPYYSNDILLKYSNRNDNCCNCCVYPLCRGGCRKENAESNGKNVFCEGFLHEIKKLVGLKAEKMIGDI